MVYLTGDTHGDIQRFKQGKLRWLGKKDTVVVLGDFGFVWDGSAAERKRRQRVPCVPGQRAGAGGQELSLLRRRGKSG